MKLRSRPIIRLSVFTVTAFLVTTAFVSAAPAGSQGFTFNLTKRNDYVELLHVGGGYLFKISHWDKSSDETTVTSKIGPLTPEPGGSDDQFILLDVEGPSEVRLEITHLPKPYANGSGSNRGEWALAISGHGPAFEEVRRAVVDHRMSDDWKGDDDLTLHGGAFGVASDAPLPPLPVLTYAEADRHLNRSYKALRSRLTAADKETLLLQQRLWLQRLDPIKDTQARARMVEQRAQEFDARIQAIGN